MYFPPAESAESMGVSSRVTVLEMVISTSARLEVEATNPINKDSNTRGAHFTFIGNTPFSSIIEDIEIPVNSVHPSAGEQGDGFSRRR
jgi:hypothetical protein